MSDQFPTPPCGTCGRIADQHAPYCPRQFDHLDPNPLDYVIWKDGSLDSLVAANPSLNPYSRDTFDRILEDIREMERQEALQVGSVGLFQQMPSPWVRRPTDEYTMNHQPTKENPMSKYREDKAVAQAAIYEAEEELNRARAKHEKAQNRLREAGTRLELAREAYKTAGWPEEPPLRYVPVIRGYVPPVTVTFSRRSYGGDRRYSYAAVGVRNEAQDRTLWYLTGNAGHRGEAKTWEELMEFAGDLGRATLCVVQATKYIGVSR